MFASFIRCEVCFLGVAKWKVRITTIMWGMAQGAAIVIKN